MHSSGCGKQPHLHKDLVEYCHQFAMVKDKQQVRTMVRKQPHKVINGGSIQGTAITAL